MQLHSFDAQKSQALEAHAAAFASVKVSISLAAQLGPDATGTSVLLQEQASASMLRCIQPMGRAGASSIVPQCITSPHHATPCSSVTQA